MQRNVRAYLNVHKTLSYGDYISVAVLFDRIRRDSLFIYFYFSGRLLCARDKLNTVEGSQFQFILGIILVLATLFFIFHTFLPVISIKKASLFHWLPLVVAVTQS